MYAYYKLGTSLVGGVGRVGWWGGGNKDRQMLLVT